MQFACVFAVRDIKKAKKFYEELFGLSIESDYGRNIVFDCGLSLQEDFDWLTGIHPEDIKNKANNCEMYFGVDDFDEFAGRLKLRSDIELLHDVLETPWGQRVIRFYDCDGHLIEAGENMKDVVMGFLKDGLSMAEVADRIDAEVNDVYKILIS